MLQRFFQKLSLATYRKTVTDNQQKIVDELRHLHQQLFVNNPVLVVGNVKMHLPLFYIDHIQKIVYSTRNFYEIETLQLLKKEFGQFESVIDIGTNIGNHMLYWCSEMGAGKVMCFEPNDFNRTVLLKNIELNHLESIVTVQSCALGSESGKGVQSNFTLGNTGMNRVDKVGEGSASSTTDIKKLDDFPVNKVNFIKIDVEGFETEVLKGALETIKRCKPV
ncbi:MAG: FkbM family methyltransferase, partial [Chitinophagaceae bacterium]|nr:FkbM family methyltransferase [Chitinophagaceae bacterium]